MHRIIRWPRKSRYQSTKENRFGKKGVVLERDGGLSDMPSLSYVIAAVDGELFEEGTFTYLIYERDSALPSFPRTESCLNWINVNVRGGSFHSK